jgi:hypothetical protein
MCTVCRRRKREGAPTSAPPKLGGGRARWEAEVDHDGDDEAYEEEVVPEKAKTSRQKDQRQATAVADPQVALENVLKNLEADFELHKT